MKEQLTASWPTDAVGTPLRREKGAPSPLASLARARLVTEESGYHGLMTVVSGELEQLGFDEVEPGLVEDTPENRAAIYRLKGWHFLRIHDDDGSETGLIRPVPPEDGAAIRESKARIYRPLLVDPDDPWSDYVGPDDFPMDAPAPLWVLERLRRWRDQDARGVPVEERKPFPIRCETFRYDETRCWNWVGKPDEAVRRCGAHIRKAGADSARVAADVKARLIGMSPRMADGLERLAEHGETDAVKLKAMTEILDRAGIRAGFEIDQKVEVEVVDPTLEVQRRLEKLAKARIEMERRQQAAALEQDTVEGEVVHDDERRALPSGE